MKFLKNPANLPVICCGLGVVGLGLRWWLLSTGYDSKGLLVSSHPAIFLTALVCLLAAGASVLAVCSRADTRRSAGMFPASLTAAISSAAAGISMALSGWNCFAAAQTMLPRVCGIFGFLAASCALFLAYCRFRGLRPHFLMRSIITVFFMLYLVQHYQQWFSEPQLNLYLPHLVAHVLLMIASFQRTALECGTDGRKLYILSSQLAGFFCLLSVPGAQDPLFHGVMAIWMFADTGRLRLPKRPSAAPAQGDDAHGAA